MDLRLIALDLDGTTLNSQGKVSPYTKKILEKALSKGILVVIASGRALSAIPEDILNIRGLKYIITSNGDKTCDHRKQGLTSLLNIGRIRLIYSKGNQSCHHNDQIL